MSATTSTAETPQRGVIALEYLYMAAMRWFRVFDLGACVMALFLSAMSAKHEPGLSLFWLIAAVALYQSSRETNVTRDNAAAAVRNAGTSLLPLMALSVLPTMFFGGLVLREVVQRIMVILGF